MTMSNVRPLPVEHVVHSLRIDMHMLLVPLSEDGRTGQRGAILGFRCLSRARESRRDDATHPCYRQGPTTCLIRIGWVTSACSRRDQPPQTSFTPTRGTD